MTNIRSHFFCLARPSNVRCHQLTLNALLFPGGSELSCLLGKRSIISLVKYIIYNTSSLVLVKSELIGLILLYFLQWRYCIRLENMGSEVVQLRERHWRIFSLSGTLETVRGRGVVGRVSTPHMPTLNFTAFTLLALLTVDTEFVLRVLNQCNESLQEPVLSKEQPAFQYSSHVSLQAPSGHMWYGLNLFHHSLFSQFSDVTLFCHSRSSWHHRI